MKKKRKHYSAEPKAAMGGRHLLDKVPVSDLGEELGLRPSRWFAPGIGFLRCFLKHPRIERSQCLENPASRGRNLRYAERRFSISG
jgi:hypothetical protein